MATIFRITLLAVLALACRDSKPAQRYEQAPVNVVASFKNFADSIEPSLIASLASSGYEVTERKDGASLRSPIKLFVHQVTEQERNARIFEASIEAELRPRDRDKNGFPEEQYVELSFANAQESPKWLLLTSEGYLYALSMRENSRSDLPFDVQLAIRNVFNGRVDIDTWLAYVEEKTKAHAVNATSSK